MVKVSSPEALGGKEWGIILPLVQNGNGNPIRGKEHTDGWETWLCCASLSPNMFLGMVGYQQIQPQTLKISGFFFPPTLEIHNSHGHVIDSVV